MCCGYFIVDVGIQGEPYEMCAAITFCTPIIWCPLCHVMSLLFVTQQNFFNICAMLTTRIHEHARTLAHASRLITLWRIVSSLVTLCCLTHYNNNGAAEKPSFALVLALQLGDVCHGNEQDTSDVLNWKPHGLAFVTRWSNLALFNVEMIHCCSCMMQRSVSSPLSC